MGLATLFAFAAIFAVACASPGLTIAALIARVLGRGLAGAPAFCAGR
jgi:threonine/homoserine/homoserine lactone efflux protein